MKLRGHNIKGFTMVETLAGVMVCSWLFIACHVLFTGTVTTTNSVLASQNPNGDSIAFLANQMASDINQSIHVFTTDGTLLVNGKTFSESQWYHNAERILPYDTNLIFRGLKAGYNRYGKKLSIKKTKTQCSLLLMGNQGRVISYYEFTNNSNNSVKDTEIKRFVGQKLTHHIKTEEIKQIALKIDPTTKSLILNHMTQQGFQHKDRFPLPYVPT